MTWDTGHFTYASFGGTPSGSAFTGGVNATEGSTVETASLDTPAVTKYAYDTLDNLTRVEQKGGRANPADWRTRTFTYNSLSQLLSATNPESGAITYTYDSDGKRLKKTGGKLYWYGAGSNVLAESDLSGNLSDEYVFFEGKRIARRIVSSNTVQFYFADHLGSSRVVANATGTILDDSDFYPFGGERVVTASSGNAYKFTGQLRDSESGLDFFNARYYASTLGRFLSPDEFKGGAVNAFSSSDPLPEGPLTYADIADPQSLNKYSYTLNNPFNFIDPDGHAPQNTEKKAKRKLDSEEEAIVKFAAGAAICGPLCGIVNLLIDPPAVGDTSEPPTVGGAIKEEAKSAAIGMIIPVPGGRLLGKGLGAIEKKAIGKAENIMAKELSTATLRAAAREARGLTVATKATGQAFDHITKAQNGLRGLKDHATTLTNALKNKNLSAEARAAIQANLARINQSINRTREFFRKHSIEEK